MNIKLSSSIRHGEFSTRGVMPGPNGILQITRSVICVNQSRTLRVLDLSMREQSRSTTVREVCRAVEQTSGKGNPAHANCNAQKN